MKISSTQASTTYSFHTIAVSGANEMTVHVCQPEAAGEYPGLILLQEAFGVNEHILNVGRRLAAQGYIVHFPELFHRTAPPKFVGSYGDFSTVASHCGAITIESLSADLKATYDALTSVGRVANGQVGAIGFCMGGKAAFLANQILPLKASVSFYGGGIAPELLKRVDRLAGPQLLIWGGQDAHIPFTQTRAIEDALTSAGKKFTNVNFGWAGHGFFCEDRPSFSADAARMAWPLTLEFMKGAFAGA